MVIKFNTYLVKLSKGLQEKAIKKFYPKKHYTLNLIKHMETLSDQERAYLNRYISHEKEVLYVELCDNIMARLYTKEITERIIERRKLHKGYGYILNPWARQYFEEHKELFVNCHTGQVGNRRG